MIDITFMRHGQIEENCETIPKERLNFADGNSFKLSQLGRRNVQNAVPALLDQNFDAIICSTALRTVETANIINKKLQLPVFLESGIDAWKASKKQSFITAEHYWDMFYHFYECNGTANSNEVDWETFDELVERTTKALSGYFKFNHPLVITHSIIISLYTDISIYDGIDYCKTYRKNNLTPIPPKFKDYI